MRRGEYAGAGRGCTWVPRGTQGRRSGSQIERGGGLEKKVALPGLAGGRGLVALEQQRVSVEGWVLRTKRPCQGRHLPSNTRAWGGLGKVPTWLCQRGAPAIARQFAGQVEALRFALARLHSQVEGFISDRRGTIGTLGCPGSVARSDRC